MIRRKKGLRDRKERIEDNLMAMERKMKWKLEDIAREQERLGKKVWVSYGKLSIDGVWWFWNEDGEVLRDSRNRRGLKLTMGEGKGEENGGRK